VCAELLTNTIKLNGERLVSETTQRREQYHQSGQEVNNYQLKNTVCVGLPQRLISDATSQSTNLESYGHTGREDTGGVNQFGTE
jgi:hypothetical protein